MDHPLRDHPRTRSTRGLGGARTALVLLLAAFTPAAFAPSTGAAAPGGDPDHASPDHANHDHANHDRAGHDHGSHGTAAHDVAHDRGAGVHSGHGPGADEHAHHRAMLGGGVQVEQVGDLQIPDLPVVTQDGREVRFFSDLVEGKVVAMNFVFTTCRTICPPLGANFGKLQDELGDRLDRDVRLISVSVDPVTDTPERLRAWGETFGAGPGWTLVTGSKEKITQLLKSLGVFTPDIRDHSPTVLVGNPATGTWTRAYGLAPPPELAKMIARVSDGADSTRRAEHGSHQDPGAEGGER